jgi:hypothetical protein
MAQIGIDAVALWYLPHHAPGAMLSAMIRRISSLDHNRRRRDPLGFLLDPVRLTSSIVPTIVDGHYPRAGPGALSILSASGPGGSRRRVTNLLFAVANQNPAVGNPPAGLPQRGLV